MEQVGHASHRPLPPAKRCPAFHQPHPELGPGLRPSPRQRLGVPLRPAPHVASRRWRSQRRGQGWLSPPYGLSRITFTSRHSASFHAHHEGLLPQLRQDLVQVRRQSELYFEE